MRKLVLNMKMLGCVLAALLAAGCNMSEPNYDAPAGQAIIRIGTGGNASARSLVPDGAPAFIKYELVFTAPGKDDVYKSLTSSRDRGNINGGGYAVDLEEAAWTVTVSAFVAGTSSTFLEAARGTASLSIPANPTAELYLTPLSMDGETMGILTWNIVVSGVSGVRIDGSIAQVIDGTPEVGKEPSSFNSSRELPSGYYLLSFTLYKDGKSAGVFRAVHIYPGLTTKAEGPDFTFTEADFVEQKYLFGTVTISGIPGGRAVEWVKIRPYQNPSFTIPLSATAADVDLEDNSWFLSVPGNAAEVCFKVTAQVGGTLTAVYNLSGETAAGSISVNIPPNGKKDIVLSAVWSENDCTVSYAGGLGSVTLSPDTVKAGAKLLMRKPVTMNPPGDKSFVGWTINAGFGLLPVLYLPDKLLQFMVKGINHIVFVFNIAR